MKPDEHIRGLSLIEPKKLNDDLHGWSFFNRGMPVGPVVIPHRLEGEHFLVCGVTGTGKSTLIRHWLTEIVRRKEAAVVFDYESDYVQHFYDPARGDLVLNALDARCPFWAPWLEFRPDHHLEPDIEAFVGSLFRKQASTARDSQQKFFTDASRTFTAAILQKTDNIPDMIRFINQTPDRIHMALRGTPAYHVINTKAFGQNAAVLADTINVLKTFRFLPRKDRTSRDWSARSWTANPQGLLFLTSDQNARDSVGPLQECWLDAIARHLLSAPIGSRQPWIVADELSLLGYQTRIRDALVGGRKRGVNLVIGFQNFAQMRKEYGLDDAETMLSQPRTKVFFGGGSNETNEWVSKQIGKEEVKRVFESVSRQGWWRKSRSEAEHRLTNHLVMADDIDKLRREPGTAYLVVGGYDRTKITIPNCPLKQKSPAFIPRGQAPEPELIIVPDPEPTAAASPQAALPLAEKPLPTASIWSNMEARCRPRSELQEYGGTYAKHTQWAYYGGRQRCGACGNLYPGDGRKCDREGCGQDVPTPDPVRLEFGNMDEVMASIDPETGLPLGPRPSMQHTIDRINNEGHYADKNVRWRLQKDQNANRRNTKRAA